MECSQSIPDRYYLIKNRTVFLRNMYIIQNLHLFQSK